jgi:tRNA (guanine37-N1)-methyltransferase
MTDEAPHDEAPHDDRAGVAEAEPPLIAFELVTLFPEIFDEILRISLLGKAIAAGLVAVHRTNPRDFAAGKHRSVDDTPYGGGPGMILRVEPMAAALDAIAAARGPSRRVLLSPQGARFDQAHAHRLAAMARVTLICGRYEGFDERIATGLCDEQLSIGDYVLAGGELAAAVVIEAVARLVPGVLGCGLSAADESFSSGRLEYPQWTRPPEWRGQAVPAVLLSGDHQAIERWRRREALRRTAAARPDLLAAHPLTDEERRLLGPADALTDGGGRTPGQSGGDGGGHGGAGT